MKTRSIITISIYAIALVLCAALFLNGEKSALVLQAEADTQIFAGLPLGVEKPVQLNLAESATFYGLSPEEMSEQIRDWLLYLVLVSGRMSASDLAHATYDMPPLRRGYTKTSADFEYGPIRSAYLGNGAAVVLLPENQTDENRRDSLSQVADNFMLEQNAALTTLHLFEYCIELPASLSDFNTFNLKEIEFKIDPQSTNQNDRNISAQLSYQGVIAGSRLYSAEFGMIERVIHGKEDLERFLSDTDDLISIQPGSDGLLAIGRKYRNRPYGRLTVEHIATLWQAYDEIDAERAAENARVNALINGWVDRNLARKLFELDADFADWFVAADKKGQYHFNYGSLSAEEEKRIREYRKKLFDDYAELFNSLQEKYGGCKWQNMLISLRNEGAGKSDEGNLETIISEFKEYRQGLSPHQRSLLRGAAGFSLDSDYNFDVLRKTFLEFIEKDDSFISELLLKFEKEILEGFKDRDPDLLLCLLQDLDDPDDDRFYRYVQASIISPARYQIARYDGGIEGTEVGQILFVTDLLAKLLDFDFSGIFHTYFENVELEWVPSTYRMVPVMYQEQQKKLPGTRLWFGIKNEAYAIDQGAGTIRFSHVATRVYALSRKLFGKDEETQPAYLATRFVDWFNNYFEQVGRIEPNYDRLNQIIKWSIAIDYIKSHIYEFGPEKLAFLGGYEVRRNLWFPEWAKSNTSYPAEPPWVACFHPRGEYRDDVETMPVFHVKWANAPQTWCEGPSPQDESRVWVMNGGVSLPRVSKAKGNYQPSKLRRVPSARRANIVEDKLTVSDDFTAISFKPEYKYRKSYEIRKTSQPNRIRINRVTEGVQQEADGSWKPAQQSVYHRGSSVEIRDLPLADDLTADWAQNRVDFQSYIGNKPAVKTSFTADSATLRIAQQSDVFDIGHSLGLKLGRVEQRQWSKILLADHRVDAVARFDDASVLVKLKDRNAWIELMTEKKPAVDIPETWDARLGDKTLYLDYILKTEPKPVLVRVIPEIEVAERASAFKWLTVKQHTQKNLERSIEIRGPPGEPPPPRGSSIALGSPEGPFRGSFDSERMLLVFERKENVSAESLELSNVVRSLNEVDLYGKMSALPANFDGTVIIPLKKPAAKINPEVLTHLNNRRLEAFARDLRGNPDEVIASIRQVRSDYQGTLVKALDAGDREMVSRIMADYQRTFSPTPQERVRYAFFESEDLLSKKHLQRLKKIVEETGNPADIPTELAVQIESILKSEGSLAAEEAMKADRLFLAKAGRNKGSPEILLDLEQIDGLPTLRARFYHPIEQRPLAEGELDGVKTIYIHNRLAISEIPTSQTIKTVVNDPVVIEITDPGRSAGRAISDAEPDILLLGDALEFQKVSKQPAKFDFERLKDTSPEDWISIITENFTRLSRLSPSAAQDGSGSAGDGEEKKLLLLTSASLLSGTCFCGKDCREKVEAREREKPNEGR